MKTQTRLLRTYTLPFGPEPDEAWAQAGPDWTQHRVFDVFCINLYLASHSDIEPSTAVSLRLHGPCIVWDVVYGADNALLLEETSGS